MYDIMKQDMKYKYSVRIHSVATTEQLESVMNEYGSKGIRVIKADFLDSKIVKGRQEARYTLYLEEKIKNKKN
jgi:hypothetical protein